MGDHVPELPMTRRDLPKVQRNLRNASKRHQDPSRDCQDPWQWSGTTRFTLVIPGASGAPHGSSRSLGPPPTPKTTSQTYPETGEVQRNSRGTSGTLPTATKTPHVTFRTHGNGQVHSGDPRSQWGSSRKLTESRAATNAVDHVPDLPMTRGDLPKVQMNLRNASKRHQDPSRDCQ